MLHDWDEAPVIVACYVLESLRYVIVTTRMVLLMDVDPLVAQDDQSNSGNSVVEVYNVVHLIGDQVITIVRILPARILIIVGYLREISTRNVRLVNVLTSVSAVEKHMPMPISQRMQVSP